MTGQRPPVHLTARVLSYGSLTAAGLLGLSLALDVAGITDVAAPVGFVGVIALLLTPATGLAATWWELRAIRPLHAWLAVAVLGVLGIATLVAFVTH